MMPESLEISKEYFPKLIPELVEWRLQGGGTKRVALKARTQQWAGTEGPSGPSILIDPHRASGTTGAC